MTLGETDLDHIVKLSTDESAVTGTLRIEPTTHPEIITADTLRGILDGHGVRSQFIDKRAIEILVDRVKHDPGEGHDAIIAHGITPVHGSDPTFRLSDTIQPRVDRVEAHKALITSGGSELKNAQNAAIEQRPDATTDTEGDEDAVNFYDHSAFVIVERGEIVAHIVQCDEAQDGTDIFGRNIPAKGGMSPKQLVGNSMTIDENGNCIANHHGLLEHTDASISIETTLRIDNDVDFSTGNIDFPGDVVVRGGVRDKFKVLATGELEIHELVEVAQIATERSLVLHNGMAGKNQGTISVERDLEVGYLEGVIGDIRGNASVRRELTNCNLNIMGALAAERAALRGGAVWVAKGAEVGSLGSAQGVETTVMLGAMPELLPFFQNITALATGLDKRIKNLTEQLENYKRALRKPTPMQIEEQMAMEFTIDELCSRDRKLMRAHNKLCDVLSHNTNTRLVVHKAIYPRVKVYLPGYLAEFLYEVSGHSVIELDAKGEPMITHKGETHELKSIAELHKDPSIPEPPPRVPGISKAA